MKVVLALLLLGVAATVSGIAVEPVTEPQDDDEQQFNEAVGAVIENVRRRLQGEQADALPDDAKEVADDLYKELKDLPDTLEQEELAALVESGAEYGWLKKTWKKIRKGAKKIIKEVLKVPIGVRVVGTFR